MQISIHGPDVFSKEGGIPPLLSSSTNNFLTTGARVAGFSLQGRPTLSMSTVVPSFVSMFANPLMSIFSPWSVYNLPAGRRSSSSACFACPRSTFHRWSQFFACSGQACRLDHHQQVCQPKRIVGSQPAPKGSRTSVVAGWPFCADFSAKETALPHQRYHFMDGGRCYFLPNHGLQLPLSLERPNAIPAVDPADISPFFWQSLVHL